HSPPQISPSLSPAPRPLHSVTPLYLLSPLSLRSLVARVSQRCRGLCSSIGGKDRAEDRSGCKPGGKSLRELDV
ncbi:hypothetical protein F7725_014690, partial [Dissostichus mawsoni]